MRVLERVIPTPEQLKIITINPSGIVLIRGAAGSGKTTTALLRLKHLSRYWSLHKSRDPFADSVKMLVLTYNRTLRGYVEALAEAQVNLEGVDLEVRTFSAWALHLLGGRQVVDQNQANGFLRRVAQQLPTNSDFLLNEVQYVLGRFLPEELDSYLDARRTGRGVSPRVDRALRTRILTEVIRPYALWKEQREELDWNDIAVTLGRNQLAEYDVVIIDEAQDFSANQMRAVLKQLANDHSLTLVLDAAQRIYANAFQWREVNITVTNTNTFTLRVNYRNTVEIAQFATPLLEGLDLTDDGTVPDFRASDRHGPKPLVLRGRFNNQLKAAIDYVRTEVDLATESVAFLHLKGGGWFDTIKEGLRDAGLEFVEISRNGDWPVGPENVALSTLHSAKGLEFDHVVLIGFNGQLTPHGSEEGDTDLETLRRLLAMAVGRARKSIVLGYKPEDASALVRFLEPTTYQARDL